MRPNHIPGRIDSVGVIFGGICGGRRADGASRCLDAQTAEFPVEGGFVDTQFPGGLKPVAFVAFQRGQDHVPFTILQAAEGEFRARLPNQPERQVFDADEGALGQHEPVLDDVLEFADVPRVFVGGQQTQGFRCHPFDVRFLFQHQLVDVVPDKGEDVLGPLPEGRQIEFNDIDPIIKVATERIILHHGRQILIGGGATPMELSSNLREYATTVGGREQLAIEAFATAIEIIPRTLAENAGLDPINTLIDLRKAHKSGKKNMGLNVWDGIVTDMKKMKIIEPMRVMKQAILGATETAIMILRIDDVIASKSGGAPGGMPPGGMPPGGMGGMGGMGDMD